MANSDKRTDLSERLKHLSPEKKRLLAVQLNSGDTHQSNSPDQQITAFLTANQTVDRAALENHLQSHLPRYMLPSQLVIVEQFPRTPNGKLDRDALKAAASASTRPQPPVPATPLIQADDVEAGLNAIWRRLLKLDQVLPEESFFDLGGHSLLAIRMLAEVKTAFHVDVPVSLIVEEPTLRRLANYLRAATANPQTSSISVLQSQGEGIPLYFLPLHVHGALHYRHLKTQLGSDRPLYAFDSFAVPDTALDPPTVEELATAYLAELLAFQPAQPYILCGISIAGLIAFEMARQLRARGVEQVSVLLLDTHGPDYPHALTPAGMLNQALSALLHPHRLRAGLITQADSLINFAGNIYSSTATRRIAAFVFRKELSLDTTDSAFDSDTINRQLGRMTRAYFAQQRDYAGDLILYRASLQPRGVRYSETLGWERFVHGKIRVETAHGDHLGILKRRNSQRLARHVRSLLGGLDIFWRTKNNTNE